MEIPPSTLRAMRQHITDCYDALASGRRPTFFQLQAACDSLEDHYGTLDDITEDDPVVKAQLVAFLALLLRSGLGSLQQAAPAEAGANALAEAVAETEVEAEAQYTDELRRLRRMTAWVCSRYAAQEAREGDVASRRTALALLRSGTLHVYAQQLAHAARWLEQQQRVRQWQQQAEQQQKQTSFDLLPPVWQEVQPSVALDKGAVDIFMLLQEVAQLLSEVLPAAHASAVARGVVFPVLQESGILEHCARCALLRAGVLARSLPSCTTDGQEAGGEVCQYQQRQAPQEQQEAGGEQCQTQQRQTQQGSELRQRENGGVLQQQHEQQQECELSGSGIPPAMPGPTAAFPGGSAAYDIAARCLAPMVDPISFDVGSFPDELLRLPVSVHGPCLRYLLTVCAVRMDKDLTKVARARRVRQVARANGGQGRGGSSSSSSTGPDAGPSGKQAQRAAAGPAGQGESNSLGLPDSDGVGEQGQAQEQGPEQGPGSKQGGGDDVETEGHLPWPDEDVVSLAGWALRMWRDMLLEEGWQEQSAWRMQQGQGLDQEGQDGRDREGQGVGPLEGDRGAELATVRDTAAAEAAVRLHWVSLQPVGRVRDPGRPAAAPPEYCLSPGLVFGVCIRTVRAATVLKAWRGWPEGGWEGQEACGARMLRLALEAGRHVAVRDVRRAAAEGAAAAADSRGVSASAGGGAEAGGAEAAAGLAGRRLRRWWRAAVGLVDGAVAEGLHGVVVRDAEDWGRLGNLVNPWVLEAGPCTGGPSGGTPYADADVTAALAAGWLPCMERLVRRAAAGEPAAGYGSSSGSGRNGAGAGGAGAEGACSVPFPMCYPFTARHHGRTFEGPLATCVGDARVLSALAQHGEPRGVFSPQATLVKVLQRRATRLGEAAGLLMGYVAGCTPHGFFGGPELRGYVSEVVSAVRPAADTVGFLGGFRARWLLDDLLVRFRAPPDGSPQAEARPYEEARACTGQAEAAATGSEGGPGSGAAEVTCGPAGPLPSTDPRVVAVLCGQLLLLRETCSSLVGVAEDREHLLAALPHLPDWCSVEDLYPATTNCDILATGCSSILNRWVKVLSEVALGLPVGGGVRDDLDGLRRLVIEELGVLGVLDSVLRTARRVAGLRARHGPAGLPYTDDLTEPLMDLAAAFPDTMRRAVVSGLREGGVDGGGGEGAAAAAAAACSGDDGGIGGGYGGRAAAEFEMLRLGTLLGEVLPMQGLAPNLTVMCAVEKLASAGYVDAQECGLMPWGAEEAVWLARHLLAAAGAVGMGAGGTGGQGVGPGPTEWLCGLPAGSLQPCSYPSCVSMSCDSEVELLRGLKACGRCGAAWYCCRECQVAHWREGHKAVCGRRG